MKKSAKQMYSKDLRIIVCKTLDFDTYCGSESWYLNCTPRYLKKIPCCGLLWYDYPYKKVP